MRLRARLDRLTKSIGEARPTGPLYIVLREAEPGQTLGRSVSEDGRSMEIIYDPGEGLPELPPDAQKVLILTATDQD